MADAKVNIIISAKDQASGVFKGILGGLKDIGKIATGFIVGDLLSGAIRGVTQAIPDMISKASDLNETVSKVGVIFGESAGDIEEWAAAAANNLGQTKQQAMDAASTFATFGKASGLAGDELVDFSTTMGNLSADLASFYNTSPEDAITALGAALRGESEPIRRYGVLLDDATLRQKALEMGLVDTIKNALTPQQRALAAYQVILDQTADAQGDFARTSGGLANQQRILKANLENLKTSLGTNLLPVVNSLVKTFNDWFSSTEGQNFFEGIVMWVETLGEWLGKNIPIAIQILSQFWTNTLQPAIQVVWEWMSSVLIPFLVNEVYPWLAKNIPIALQILSDFWTNTLQPAIQAVWQWMSTTLIPFLQNVVFPWLATNIPIAIQALSDFWNNVLLPAIQAVWKFLTVDMMPVWEALGELLGVVIPLVLTALAGLWQNVLKPALDAIWKFIKENVLPIFQRWSDSVGGVSGAIQKVVDWIHKMTDALRNVKLPDWLTPGSPTPFEMGLRGISSALEELNRKQLPEFAMNVAGVGQRQVGQNNNTTHNWNLTINEAGRTVNPSGAFAMMRALAG